LLDIYASTDKARNGEKLVKYALQRAKRIYLKENMEDCISMCEIKKLEMLLSPPIIPRYQEWSQGCGDLRDLDPIKIEICMRKNSGTTSLPPHRED